MHLRRYASADLESLYDICLLTGAAGEDATGTVEDPRIFGDIFAAPYGVLEPHHAFVLDPGDEPLDRHRSDGERMPAPGRMPPIGYVLGVRDTADFEARCESSWWPAVRERHPGTGDRLDDLLAGIVHHRRLPPASFLERFPSHLHIDLLPEAQGLGWGRRMMEALLDSLRQAGSPGVHWGVSPKNTRALAFYRHLGATEAHADAYTITFTVTL